MVCTVFFQRGWTIKRVAGPAGLATERVLLQLRGRIWVKPFCGRAAEAGSREELRPIGDHGLKPVSKEGAG